MAGPLFRVESDVTGASVFIDRVYLGTTPLETRDVAAGHHRLNVSAQGFEGYSGDVEIAEGASPVVIRFREVRLDATIDVVHKHGMGACEGKLHADATGIGYATTNRGDAFRISYGNLEALDLDYLKKNLRLKVRGGRTYNFTDKAANADALFVFQRDVQKTRDRLAKGDPPAGKSQ